MKKAVLNGALRILLCTNALVLVAAAMLGPIYALFVKEIGGSLLDASLTGGVFALAAGITTYVSGRYTDRIYESKYIISFGYGLMGIGFILFTQVQSLWFLFLVQALIGIGEAIYAPAFDVLYSKHLEKHKEGREWGAWEAVNYFSIAGGAILGGAIATTYGFDPLFITMGGFCLLSALYLALLRRHL